MSRASCVKRERKLVNFELGCRIVLGSASDWLREFYLLSHQLQRVVEKNQNTLQISTLLKVAFNNKKFQYGLFCFTNHY